MIRFKIDGEPYIIDDFMSIENYVKIYKIKDLFSEDYFAAKLVSIVSGAPQKDLLEGGYEEVGYLALRIMELLPTVDTTKFVDRFELDGVQYGFFPNWRDLTFAEFIDLDTISNKKEDELLDMLHILAAIMYRPIVEELSEHNFKIEEYDIPKMKERAELFKKRLDVRYVIGAQFFFIKFAKTFSNFILPSSTLKLSKWQTIKMIWIMWRMIFKQTSKSRSVGFWSSTKLLTMILQNTSTSIKKT
jgi:hypothetical protein